MDPQEWVGTGLTLGIVESKVIVSGVYMPSPAKTAGLLIGDEIVSFEGHLLKGMPPAEIAALFQSSKKSGTIVTLEVMHPDKLSVQSIKLQVKSLL